MCHFFLEKAPNFLCNVIFIYLFIYLYVRPRSRRCITYPTYENMEICVNYRDRRWFDIVNAQSYCRHYNI